MVSGSRREEDRIGSQNGIACKIAFSVLDRLQNSTNGTSKTIALKISVQFLIVFMSKYINYRYKYRNCDFSLDYDSPPSPPQGQTDDYIRYTEIRELKESVMSTCELNTNTALFSNIHFSTNVVVNNFM